MENDIQQGGEYQINDGIKRMMQKGSIFKTGSVQEWMDCGNKDVTIETNSKMLKILSGRDEQLVSDNITLNNSKIIEPCFIGDHVILTNCTIGPYVSIGDHTIIEDSNVKNSIIQKHTQIIKANLDHAMIGNHVIFHGNFNEISLGDYSTLNYNE